LTNFPELQNFPAGINRPSKTSRRVIFIKTRPAPSKPNSIGPTSAGLAVLLFVAGDSERDTNLFSGSRPTLPVSYGTNTRRKPILSLRFSGLSLLRFAERQFCALLFQLPPRLTRFEPSI